ncbi:hypothetical protein CTAYLR_001844 [Chrysophaeum taylorii]|uniref:Chitin-binding type-4 domain-containing protein n=1 Tax=Chrysophaeum taylorii TaxID=2483200 RepID=A0AAD7U883_9STRA|nr:hypothetical protein CTAYLR_001844 [Chrysophaeum taylorii]
MEMVELHAFEASVPAFAAITLLWDMNLVMRWKAPQATTLDWTSWTVEDEPETGPSDSWARGSILSKPKRTERAYPPLSLDDSVTNGSAPSSSRSIGLKRRRKSPNDNCGTEPLMFSLAEEADSVYSKSEFARPTTILEEDDVATRRENRLELLQQRLQSEDEELLERVAALKDKKWTMDAAGGIILIQPPEDLNKSNHPSYAVKETPKDVEEEELREPDDDSDENNTRAARDAPRVCVLESCQAFKGHGYEQPPLVADLRVASGVTVRQGKKYFVGAPTPKDPNHLSLAEYESTTGTSCAQSVLFDASSNYGSDAATSVVVGHISSEPRLPARPRLAPIKVVKQPLPGPEVDALVGGRPLEASQSEPRVRTASDDDDDNLKLIRAPDWGQLSAVLKEPVVGRVRARQSSRQRARTFEIGAGRGRAARVRNAGARPTRRLSSLRVPPRGLSDAGLRVLRSKFDSASNCSHDSIKRIMQQRLIVVTVLALHIQGGWSHGYLFDPPSRQRLAYEYKPESGATDYCPHCTLAAPMLAQSDTLDLASRPYPGNRAFAEPGTAPSVDFHMNGNNPFGVCGTEKLGDNDYNVPNAPIWGDPDNAAYKADYETEFKAGDVIDVSWCVNADHGGVYSWRLCDDPDIVKKFWSGAVLSDQEQRDAEECFQRGILRCDDVDENSCGLEPRCDASWGCAEDPGKYFHCEGSSGKAYGCANSNDACYGGTLVKRKVRIPENFPTGPTIMSWRWDSDETTEVFAACSDITILPGDKSPTPKPTTAKPSVSFAPTPKKTLAPTPKPTEEVQGGICCWWSPEADKCSDCRDWAPFDDWCAESEDRCSHCGGTWCKGNNGYVPPDDAEKPSASPTKKPYASPTTTKEDNCLYEIVDGAPSNDGNGCGGDVGLDDVAVAHPEDGAAGVRCCDNSGGATSICLSNCELTDFFTAEDRCDAIGMRLCSKDEILAGNAAGTGCAYDFVKVWTLPGDCDDRTPPPTAKDGYSGGEDHCCASGECGSCFAPVFAPFWCARSSGNCEQCGGNFCYAI